MLFEWDRLQPDEAGEVIAHTTQALEDDAKLYQLASAFLGKSYSHGTHTRMVVEALVADLDWQGLPDLDRTNLFWAAVLHDVGKPAVTKHEDDGRISSRSHSRVGASIARELLWNAGSPFAWREALCGIIAHHQLPFWLIERPDPNRLAIETSWRCRPDHLCIHAKADALGRTCQDQRAILESVGLAALTFKEAGCWDHPFAFANDESRVWAQSREWRDQKNP